MLKFLKFLFAGIFFGIVLTKAEVISWYRIHEMFRFEAFHMYGIIGSAVLLGILSLQLIKISGLKTIDQKEIIITPKKSSFSRYFIGGTIFGLGWALAGACPGPMYILVGNGYSIILVVLLGALMGTLFYGMAREKLPH